MAPNVLPTFTHIQSCEFSNGRSSLHSVQQHCIYYLDYCRRDTNTPLEITVAIIPKHMFSLDVFIHTGWILQSCVVLKPSARASKASVAMSRKLHSRKGALEMGHSH